MPGDAIVVSKHYEGALIWDETKPLRVNERITHRENDGHYSVTVRLDRLLNRPLRAENPHFHDELRHVGLTPLAYKSLGNCVASQLAVCLQTCSQNHAGKRTWNLPYTVEFIEEQMDEAWLQLGYQIGEFPYEDGCWRQCGVTAKMVHAMADKLCVRVVLFHKAALFHERTPEGRLSNAFRPVIALDIFSDRAFV